MRFSGLSAALAVAQVVSLALRAGPILPGSITTDAPDEARSLAGLKRVRLEVLPLPQLLRDAGVRPSRLGRILVGPLADSGVEVANDPELPRVAVKIFAATDAKQAAAVSIGVVVAVHQSVKVQRLDRQLRVPTASVTTVSLATRDTVRAVVEHELRAVADALQRIIRVTTHRESSNE